VLRAQSLFFLTYSLLLVVKNQSFRAFLSTGRSLRSNFLFLIPWTGILLTYPILYVAIRVFTAVKGNSLPVRTNTLRKKLTKEPAHW
jgi:hypothetical protein